MMLLLLLSRCVDSTPLVGGRAGIGAVDGGEVGGVSFGGGVGGGPVELFRLAVGRDDVVTRGLLRESLPLVSSDLRGMAA